MLFSYLKDMSPEIFQDEKKDHLICCLILIIEYFKAVLVFSLANLVIKIWNRYSFYQQKQNRDKIN
ncbi:hypothetical protein BZG01_18810 [Labilibaculum manganireducens]|uniref:Uncharacterized protein n=1 Tax=Labilibaculum manganireducens TaxID=1940525 RepID=A0A2N3HUF8_9BACT|nr:hypothetical protein BZG01_18810 [Labilibaculum manganireducens]